MRESITDLGEKDFSGQRGGNRAPWERWGYKHRSMVEAEGEEKGRGKTGWQEVQEERPLCSKPGAGSSLHRDRESLKDFQQ